jgi:hypothetical protein
MLPFFENKNELLQKFHLGEEEDILRWIEYYQRIIKDFIHILSFFTKDGKHLAHYELNKLNKKDKLMANKIKKHAQNMIEKIIPRTKDLFLEIRSVLERKLFYDEAINKDQLLEVWEELEHYLSTINSILMDVYLLSRMFYTIDNRSSDVVIVFAGNFHIKDINIFLNEQLDIYPEHFIENQEDDIENQEDDKRIQCIKGQELNNIMNF